MDPRHSSRLSILQRFYVVEVLGGLKITSAHFFRNLFLHAAHSVGLLKHIPAAELLPRLRAAEIPCGPINTVPDTLADEHYRQRGNIVEMPHPRAGAVKSLANPVRLADTPPGYRLPPPMLGEHTQAVLTELGYTVEEIERLRAAGDV